MRDVEEERFVSAMEKQLARLQLSEEVVLIHKRGRALLAYAKKDGPWRAMNRRHWAKILADVTAIAKIGAAAMDEFEAVVETYEEEE